MGYGVVLFTVGWLVAFGDGLGRGGPIVQFRDVGKSVGIDPPGRDKVSGPCIADLNQDGFMDIVIANHARAPGDVYYGSRSGSFSVVQVFESKGDRHGNAVGDIDLNGFPDIIQAIGNRRTSPPLRIEFTNNRGVLSLGNYTAQGFNGLEYLFDVRLADLDGDGDLDVFATGAFDQQQQHIWENTQSRTQRFRKLNTTGVQPLVYPLFSPFVLGYLVFDYNGDGFNDIMLLSNGLRLFRGGRNFIFQDVSDQVLPSKYQSRKFNSAAAVDIDNDGDFDVYVTGGTKLKGDGVGGADLLLENRNGMLVDISAGSGIPTSDLRIGIAAGDFDNDGYIDLYLPYASTGKRARRTRDMILWNTGRKTFVPYRNNAILLSSRDLTYPTGAQPIDSNQDGRLDVVVTTRYNQKNISIFGGGVFLFQNVANNANNYFIVKVPVLIRGRTTTDAIVKLVTATRTLYRRVGGEGEGRTQSFNNHVHFGIGSTRTLRSVTLKLLNGPVFTKSLSRVRVNTMYEFRV